MTEKRYGMGFPRTTRTERMARGCLTTDSERARIRHCYTARTARMVAVYKRIFETGVCPILRAELVDRLENYKGFLTSKNVRAVRSCFDQTERGNR